MANPVVDLNQQRRELWKQYKAIEVPTLISLFDPDDPTTWTTKQLVVTLAANIGDVDDGVKTKAINDLGRSNALRQQAMNLWPAGTRAASQHQHWMGIVTDMINILKTPTNNASSSTICEGIVENSAARDDELWSSVDFDIFLEDMNQCRKKIQEVWAKAEADPTQLSVADVVVEANRQRVITASSCMLRYMRSEMNAMQLINPGWYKDGELREEQFEKWLDQGTIGIGHDMANLGHIIAQNFEGPEGKKLEEHGANLMSIFKTANILGKGNPLKYQGILGDDAWRENPAVFVARDQLVNKDGKLKEAWRTVEFFMTGLLLLDTAKPPDVNKNLQKATIGRLGATIKDLKDAKFYINKVFSGSVGEIDKIMTRCQILTTYVIKQTCSAWAIAVAYTWADRVQFLINAAVIVETPGLKALAHLYDCYQILGLEVAGEPAVKVQPERFCNTHNKFLYMDSRPRDENEWKKSFNETVLTFGLRKKIKRHQDAIMYENFVFEAMKNNYDTPRRLGFTMRAGSEEWWQAVQEKARAELISAPSPSSSPTPLSVWTKFEKDYQTRDLNAMLGKVATLDWTTQRAVVLDVLKAVPLKSAWFI
ncbi:hypothetical protein HD806DRAFT_525952 [Xylariaceae sp. AK1471]|nr:hypothetical protein HD806DRAFT_525952 [Xylariaceae sp. AK1471]